MLFRSGGGMPPAPSGPPSMGGGGFGGGNMPPPLPPIDNSVYQPGGGTDSSGPVANFGSGMYGGIPGADNSMTMGTGLAPASGDVNSAWQAAVKSAQEQRKNGFMGRIQLPGEGRYEDFVKQYNYNLMNPNQQPLTSVGNDGLGSYTQGPRDFLDGSNIAQPIGLPQIDQGFYDSQEYNDFNSGPKMGTSDVAFSRYFGQQGSGSISGQQDAAYEDYLRRTGQADKIITTNPFAPPTVGMLPGGGMFEGQPLTPASGTTGNLVDAYGNPASFSPAELEAMLAATPTLYSFQQGPNLSRPAPVPISPLESGTTVSPTGQLLHYGPNRGGLQLARRQFG